VDDDDGVCWSLMRLLANLGVAALRFVFTCGLEAGMFLFSVVSNLRAFGSGLLCSLGDLRLPVAELSGSFSLLSRGILKATLGAFTAFGARMSSGKSLLATLEIMGLDVEIPGLVEVGVFAFRAEARFAGCLATHFGSWVSGIIWRAVREGGFVGWGFVGWGFAGCLGVIHGSSSSSEEKSSYTLIFGPSFDWEGTSSIG
jgi:hypothetical protein